MSGRAHNLSIAELLEGMDILSRSTAAAAIQQNLETLREHAGELRNLCAEYVARFPSLVSELATDPPQMWEAARARHPESRVRSPRRGRGRGGSRRVNASPRR